MKNNKTQEPKGLDPGIKSQVEILRAAGIETFESCQGGPGHAFPEPTVRFYGNYAEGYKAVSVALQHNLKVGDLRRSWPIIDRELTGPYWELTFCNEHIFPWEPGRTK